MTIFILRTFRDARIRYGCVCPVGRCDPFYRVRGMYGVEERVLPVKGFSAGSNKRLVCSMPFWHMYMYVCSLV